MALPPAHRADHAPIYVLASDTAWDDDRIAYEYAVIRKEVDPVPDRPPVTWANLEDHPVRRYRVGASRADFETIRAYLSEELGPVKFIMRRLGLTKWAELQTRRMTSLQPSRIYAIRHALVRVEGCEHELDRGGRDAGPLTDKAIQGLREWIGDDEFAQLCDIAILASQEPTPPEGKP